MSPEASVNLQDLFDQLLDREPADRDEFLERVSAGDRKLRETLSELLRCHLESDAELDFLDAPAAQVVAEWTGSTATAASGDLARRGETLGNYRVERRIGTGGMSQVFLGTRIGGDYDLKVAIKLIAPGPAPREIQRRFVAECQMLADLSHPGIARILDGGTTPGGLHYLVMELIEGIRITKYCRDRQATFDQRIHLFRKVCDAVDFAHQNLIVHRDLKPSNVLVTAHGDPKLLDFGIAKVLSSASADGTGTQPTSFALTPNYCSPEQARGSRIGMPSDVYSLGILLFELVTGAPPHDWRGRGVAEMLQVLEEDQRIRASDSIDCGAGGSIERLALPDLTNDELKHRLQGDLDAVISKALRALPEERYGSVQELSQDLERYEQGHPVLARPPSFTDLVGKFIRRHRLAVSAVAFAFLVISIFASVATIQSFRLVKERDAALRARAQAEAAQAHAEDFSSLLVESLKVADPLEKGAALTAHEILEAARARAIDWESQPRAKASVLDAIGSIYLNLGSLTEADEALRLALEQREAIGPSNRTTDRELARTLRLLAEIDLQRGEFADSKVRIERATDLFGADDAPPISVQATKAKIMAAEGDLEGAERAARAALEPGDRRGLAAPSEMVAARVVFADVLTARGNYEEAEKVLRSALGESTDSFGSEHPSIEELLGSLLSVLVQQAQFETAEEVAERRLDLATRIFGDRHPRTLTAHNDLAVVWLYLGKHDQSEQTLRRVLDQSRQILGSNHARVRERLVNLGLLLHNRGRSAEGLPLLQEAYESGRSQLGPGHIDLAVLANNLAIVVKALGDDRTAETLMRECLRINRSALGATHVESINSLTNLASVLRDSGQLEAAEPLYSEALQLAEESLQPTHTVLGDIALGFARLKNQQQDYAAAGTLAARGEFVYRAALGANHWKVANALNVIGFSELGLGNTDESEHHLRAGLAILESSPGAPAAVLRVTFEGLVELFDEVGDNDQAELFRHRLGEVRLEGGDN